MLYLIPRTMLFLPLCALLLFQSAYAEEKTLIVPEEHIIACIHVPNVSQLRDKWRNSFFPQMLQDTQISRFLQPAQLRLSELAGEVELSVKKSLSELFSIFSGEFALFLMADRNRDAPANHGAADISSFPFLLIAEFHGSPSNILDLFNRLAPTSKKTSPFKPIDDANGILIYRLRILRQKEISIPEYLHHETKKRPPETPSSVTITQESVYQLQFAIVGNHILLSPYPSSLLRDAIARYKTSIPPSPPFPKRFFSAPADLPTTYAAVLFFKPGNLFSSHTPVRPFADDVFASDPLFLADIKTITLAIDFNKKNLSADLFVSKSPEDRGLSSLLFNNRRKHLRSLNLIPANATSFYASSLNLAGCWQLTSSTLHRLSPKYHSIATQLFETLGSNARIDIQNDIINNLGNEIAYFSLPTTHPAMITSPQTLLIEFRNARRFQQNVVRFAAACAPLFSYRLEPQKYKNADYFSLLPTTPYSNTTSISFAFIDHFLAISDSPDVLRRVIEVSQFGSERALPNSLVFRNFKEQLTSDTVSFSCNNFATLGDALQQSPLLRKIISSYSSAFKEYIFLDAFPTAGSLRKYLDDRLATTILKPNTLHYKIRLLTHNH